MSFKLFAFVVLAAILSFPPWVSAQQRPNRLVQHQVIAAKGDRLVYQAPPLLLARALGQPFTGH